MDEKKKDYFVAYIDVMGFTDMVNTDKTKKIDTYVETLETKVLALIDKTYKSIKFITISDTIVLLSEYKEEYKNKTKALKALLELVQEIQVIFTKKYIWLRGAISFGKVWFDKKRNILIGKGYLNAYLLEKEAIYPRVIIDPKIILELDINGAGFLSLFNKNAKNGKLIFTHLPIIPEKGMERLIEEDSFFVHYGFLLFKDMGHIEFHSFLYDNVIANLYSNQTLYNRFLWLKRYFTHSLMECHDLSPDLKIQGYWDLCIKRMKYV